MTSEQEYQLVFTACLPFRPNIEPLVIQQEHKNFGQVMVWFCFSDTFTMHFGPDIKPPSIEYPTKLCTIVYMFTSYPHPGDDNDFRLWAMKNQLMLSEQFVQVINELLMEIKYATNNHRSVEQITNIGFRNLVFCAIQCPSHWSLCVTSVVGIKDQLHTDEHTPLYINPKQLMRVPPEAQSIQRACDLTNIGYHAEAFVVIFALLDDRTQEFVKSKMQNLTEKEQDMLVKSMGNNRLERLLKLLLRLITGMSPLDNRDMDKSLEWINTKRNKIVHSGAACSKQEAIKSIQTVIDFMRYFNENGASYTIPIELSASDSTAIKPIWREG
jgi:hypothetical protein